MHRTIRRAPATLLAAAVASAVVLGSANAARAELVVCAETGRPIEVALARWEKNRFVARGWFAVAAGTCRTLITRELHWGTYYVYARRPGGASVWPAQEAAYRPICVAPDRDFRHREWSSLGPQCPEGFAQRRFASRQATTGQLTVHIGHAR